MDSLAINNLVNLSPVLKFRYTGCYPIDKIPILPSGTFQIVNTAPSGSFGEHWLLVARMANGKTLIFYDSFGRPLQNNFPLLYNMLKAKYNSIGVSIKQFVPSHSLTQSSNSTLCGLYCIFLAHFIFTNKILSGFPLYATEEDILRFVSDNFGQTYPSCVNFVSF